MSHHHLHREDAPFGEKIWQLIDETVVAAAKSQLSARLLLGVEGPFGFGVKAIHQSDKKIASSDEAVSLSVAPAVPIVSLQSSFRLSIRDLAAYEKYEYGFDKKAIASAAIACAKQEDELLFNGSTALGTEGLLTAAGSQSSPLASWQEVGKAVDDIIQAVTKLDNAGFHGPYCLALAPALYNMLFRRYPQGSMTELEHLKTLVADGVLKTPSLKAGGVLIASGNQYAAIVLGQDMMTGFVGPAADYYEFTITESLALQIYAPEAICVLK